MKGSETVIAFPFPPAAVLLKEGPSSQVLIPGVIYALVVISADDREALR